MENQNQGEKEKKINGEESLEADELSIEEIEEEDIDYEDDYLVDNDEFENQNDDTNMETIKEKDEGEMDIEIESAIPSVKGEFENIKTDGEIYAIAMNDKGVIVLGDGEDTTYFIDANKKSIIKKEKLNKDSITAIDFSCDGKFLVTGSLDGNAHIFETEDFTLMNTVNGSFAEINWLKFHPKGPVFAFGCSDGSVWVYHAQNINTSMSFFGHTDSVSCGLFSQDGKYLITASEDCAVKVWELKNQTLQHTIKGKKFHQAPICSIAIAKTKNIIATGSFENELAISNFENANVLTCLNSGNKQFSIESIAFCNDDKYVVFAGTENNLQIFDLSSLSIRMKIPLGTESIAKIMPSQLNNYILYLSSSEGNFYVLDTRGNGSLVQDDKVHADVLIDFVLTKDENYAVTCSLDKTINLVKIFKI